MHWVMVMSAKLNVLNSGAPGIGNYRAFCVAVDAAYNTDRAGDDHVYFEQF